MEVGVVQVIYFALFYFIRKQRIDNTSFSLKKKQDGLYYVKLQNNDIQTIAYTDSCLDHSNIEYSDGYISNTDIYLLDSDGSNIYKYVKLQKNDSSFEFDCSNTITFDRDATEYTNSIQRC